jgi:nucleoside-diphosphate-sugar epimerase
MNRFNHVMVTGGAGYVGSRLVPQLLDAGYRVTVYDIMYYGSAHLGAHAGLRIIKGDIRDTAKFAAAVVGCDAVIHLACISNDASFELDEALSRTVNYECFEPMVMAAKQAGVKRFIYASSSSVYGVSDKPNVTEEHPLVPLTLYNKYKGLCEPLLFKHQSPDFVCVTIRPATICGYAPRLRLDLSVNILTNHAVTNNRITVFGGSQMRPNLHIKDMCDLYQLMLEVPDEPIAGQIFNVGHQNMTITAIAGTVKGVVESEFPVKGPISIVTTPSDDLRSYHVNSDKIARVLGFRPKFGVSEAASELCAAFERGAIPGSMTSDAYYNVRTMKAIQAR